MSEQTYAPTLGTLLRRLVDHLDGAVEQIYREAGLDYRARYTPIVRILDAEGPRTLRDLADRMAVSHSAVSQTVSQMVSRGLLSTRPGADARERRVELTPKAKRLLPQLRRIWARTEAAARTIDEDLGLSLPGVMEKALAALDERPFAERIRNAP